MLIKHLNIAVLFKNKRRFFLICIIRRDVPISLYITRVPNYLGIVAITV